MKASNRSAAFTGKKNALVTNTRKEADALLHDGRVYMCVLMTYVYSNLIQLALATNARSVSSNSANKRQALTTL